MSKLGHFSATPVFLSIACAGLLACCGWEMGNTVLSFPPIYTKPFPGPMGIPDIDSSLMPISKPRKQLRDLLVRHVLIIHNLLLLDRRAKKWKLPWLRSNWAGSSSCTIKTTPVCRSYCPGFYISCPGPSTTVPGPHWIRTAWILGSYRRFRYRRTDWGVSWLL